jgi:hypothetical protein
LYPTVEVFMPLIIEQWVCVVLPIGPVLGCPLEVVEIGYVVVLLVLGVVLI